MITDIIIYAARHIYIFYIHKADCFSETLRNVFKEAGMHNWSAGPVADPGGGAKGALAPPKFWTMYSYNIVFLIVTRELWVLPNA